MTQNAESDRVVNSRVDNNIVESSVRVELLDGDPQLGHDLTAPTALPKTSKWPVVVMAVALIGLVSGLWWAASLSSGDEPAIDDAAEIEPAPVGPSVTSPPVTTAPPVGADAQPDLDPAQLFLTLPADLRQVGRGPNGLLASGTFSVDASEALQRVPALTRTVDGRVWTSGTMSNITPGARIVGLFEQPEAAEDERVLVFAAEAEDDGGLTSELVIYSSRGGADDNWAERNRFPIDGHVRSLLAQSGRWVAIVDERAQATSSVPPMRTRLATGRFDGDGVDVSSVAPDEFVSSYAAFDEGMLAVVVRLQLSGLESTSPAPELRSWTVEDGWSVLASLDVDDGAPARLIATSGSVYLSEGSELFEITSFAGAERSLEASGGNLAARVDDRLVPELTPALIDPGYLLVDNIVGETTQLWLSSDAGRWRRVDLSLPMRDLRLLQIVDGAALLTGDRNGESGVLRVDLTAPLQPDTQRRTLQDGEWTTPVFSTARTGEPGFVGLTSTNGRIDLLESSDGFTIDQATPTDFPFGYFANDMATTAAGYHVVGQLGLIEDAVFTSPDGLSWDRFAIDRPGSATALQIDHFHRGGVTAAMSGSLGWADDLSRIERVVLWWSPAGEQIRIVDRPCTDDFGACSISSLIAVDDGLIATHARDRSTAVSKWTPETGWTSLAELDPAPLASAELAATASDTVWLLGVERVMQSADDGATWQQRLQRPTASKGRFIAVAASGDGAVFQTANELWLYSNGGWTTYATEGLEVRKALAMIEDRALLSGVSSEGAVVIRLAEAVTG